MTLDGEGPLSGKRPSSLNDRVGSKTDVHTKEYERPLEIAGDPNDLLADHRWPCSGYSFHKAPGMNRSV